MSWSRNPKRAACCSRTARTSATTGSISIIDLQKFLRRANDRGLKSQFTTNRFDSRPKSRIRDMPAIPSQEILDTVDGRGSRFLLRFVSIKLEMGHVHQRFPIRRPTLVAVVRGSLAGHEAGDRILGRIKLKELGTTDRCGEGREHDPLPGWIKNWGGRHSQSNCQPAVGVQR